MAKNKRAPRTFGNAYLILDPKGEELGSPRTTKQPAIDACVLSLEKPPGFRPQTWDHLYSKGYRCVKVLMTEVLK